MSRKYNPFQPNNPVFKDMFVGRGKEIKTIDENLYQTKMGNPVNIMLLGERGIGKSSLLLVANCFAKGEFTWEEEKFNFLTIQISINDEMVLIDLAKKIHHALHRELNKTEKEIAFVKKAWTFIERIEAVSVKIKERKDGFSEAELIDSLVYSIADTIKAITSPTALSELGFREQKDGLLILIDEADSASKELKLGSFMKNLSEALIKEKCNKVMFFLAGLPRLRDSLLESHKSSLRLFEEHSLSPLTPDEINEVVKRGIAEIKEKSSVEVQVEPEALKSFVFFSEGYPHFIQQLGYSVIAIDGDNVITEDDVLEAMFMEDGALDRIGDRYYKNLYFNKIKEDYYRQILNIMADKLDKWISKKEIEKHFKGKPSSLTNGLKALRDRNIILSKSGSKGFYRLQWKGFALWIRSKILNRRTEANDTPWGSNIQEIPYAAKSNMPLSRNVPSSEGK